MRPLLLAALLAASGCATDTSTREAHVLVARGALLLDVRSAAEFAEGHARGARNVPVERLRETIERLGPRDRPIVVYCHSGARAGAATVILRNAGFREVHNLGTLARWRRDPPPLPSLW